MKGALVDVEQRVMLGEVTEAQCNAAVSVIAAHAKDRDDLLDLLDLLDKIRPTPHTPAPSPAKRRAEPRHTR